MVAVAQLVESRIVIPVVVGSSPTRHPKFKSVRFVNERTDFFFSWQGKGGTMTGNQRNDDDDEVRLPGLPPNAPNYMTPECYRRMLDERERLVKVERPEVVNIVSWAASNGDRSENGDYQYGKRRLREIDRRIRFLNKRVESAKVVDVRGRPATDQIFFGATVTYAEQGSGIERTVRIVGIDEMDPDKGDVSWISPIARVLLRAHEGDEVKLPTPKGVETLEILEVSYIGESPVAPASSD